MHTESADIHGNTANSSWLRAAAHASKDIQLWLMCVAMLLLYRAGLVWALRERMGTSTHWHDIALLFLAGFRFDARIVAEWILPLFLLGASSAWVDSGKWADRLRVLWGAVFICLVLLLFPSGILFFREFDDQFNHWIFGAVHDDLWAVVKTVNHDHPLILWTPGLVAACAGLVWTLRRWLKVRIIPERTLATLATTRWARVMVSALFVLLVVLSLRGSIGRRPVQRKDAAVTADEFLNKCTLNPLMAFYYAICDYRQLQGSEGLKAYVRDGDIRGAAMRAAGRTDALPGIDDYFLRQAPGRTPQPKHVFLIVMESYGMWAMQEPYAGLRATEGLRSLAADGLRINNFLPAADGSMLSLSTIISGLPYCGIPLNYHPSSRAPYPTALPTIFKRMGYQTRFFFSGYLSWERVGEFCRNQGFDEVYGGGQMQEKYAGNEWGVHDADLFDYVSKHVPPDTPSLNVIVTSSFHPPYSVDLNAAKFPLKSLPENLRPLWDDPETLRKVGHWWYADQAMARFVRGMAATHTPILAAITGDHYNRAFVPPGCSLYEKIGVPFVLFGPEVLAGRTLPPDAAGSHSDIPATLVDLCAPAGFKYISLGLNLLEPHPSPMAIAWHYVLKEKSMFRTKDKTVHPVVASGAALMDNTVRKEVIQRHDDLLGVTWWRIVRGNSL